MRVIVHAGMHKTGSSAIQRYLSENRDALRAEGIIYPDLGLGHQNHWPLGFALASPNSSNYLQRRASRHDEGKIARQAVESVREIIATAERDTWLLLSHESFGGSPQASNLRALLKNDAGPLQTNVIAYIRSPLAHYPSAIQQKLKSRSLDLMRPGQWTSTHMKRLRPIYEAFGDNVTLRVHGKDTLVDGDVTEDLRHYIMRLSGRHLQAAQGNNDNSSISGPGCALLCRYLIDKVGGNKVDFRALRKALASFDATTPAGKLQIPPDWIAPIAATNAVEWNAALDKADSEAESLDALRLPLEQNAACASTDEVKKWILSFADENYTKQFARYCIVNGLAGEDGERLSDWAIPFKVIDDMPPREQTD